ncbi:hypothetical protein OAF34_01550 [Pirellulaceae bacterium]|nr:hypothetical protein [Pirellulaceae bacterium]
MNQSEKIRIGAVSYLNTKPLIESLSQRCDQIELSLELPSRLAKQLADGDLDVALIPSVEVRHVLSAPFTVQMIFISRCQNGRWIFGVPSSPT